MNYSPSITPMICQGNPLDIFDTVRSHFDNYTFYKWQRSTDAGANWTDVTTADDTTVTLNGSNYQYVTRYRIPATNTTLADSADLYRLVVATTTPNLSNTACLSTDLTTIVTLNVQDCGVPLGINFISFSGKLDRGNANLIWTTSKENEPVYYSIERSYDGTSFSSIAVLPGQKIRMPQTILISWLILIYTARYGIVLRCLVKMAIRSIHASLSSMIRP